MPVATRDQIQATIALPHYKVEMLLITFGWAQILNARIASIQTTIESTNNTDNAVAFGSPSDPSASIEIEDYVFASRLISSPLWLGSNIRISFAFDTSDYTVLFTGPIKSISKENEIVTYELGGAQEHIKDTMKIYTPLYYRKPIATKTTAASQEDPTQFVYAAGLLNYAFWMSGGRPYEQKDLNYFDTDADFKFWYSCDQSLITPDYSWFGGENTITEM